MTENILLFCAVLATIGLTAMLLAISGAVVWGIARMIYFGLAVSRD